MNEILLVEDNPDDVELTRRAFRKSLFENEIVVARDGIEALDYLFGTGEHRESRARRNCRSWSCSISKLPRLDGLQVLERVARQPENEACCPS